MKNEDRIVEILSELLIESRETNRRLERLEDQQAKTNLAIGELRLSVMRLADMHEEEDSFQPINSFI